MSNHKPPARSPADPALGVDKHRNPNGTYNGVTLMAELSGLGVDEIRAIAEQCKTNHEKLNACAYHAFERIPRPDDGVIAQARLGDRWRCAHCGGEVSAIEHRWHELGRRPQPDI